MLRKKGVSRYSVIGFIVLILFIRGKAYGQSVDLKQLVPKLEFEVQRIMLEGEIPSATIALVHEDKIIWTGAFGYSNIWARTPAIPKTVYLIGSTFKTMSMYALLQQMEKGRFKLDDRVFWPASCLGRYGSSSFERISKQASQSEESTSD